MIPIVLLHHNQPQILAQCVASITQRTIHPHMIFVVDNDSDETSELLSVFTLLQEKYGVILIRNPKNNWIYGFNCALTHPRWPSSSIYAFTDSDIVVPEPVEGKCWLAAMLNEMHQHRCIGKLGISLNLDNLARVASLKDTYEMEASYNNGPRIGLNVIAPVDTTLALYRSDFFIGSFCFRIGHQSLGKPYYYTCRTVPSLNAIHLGWDYYPGAGMQSYSIARNWRKALAMSKMGTWIAPEILATFWIPRRWFLRLLKSAVKSLHAVKVSMIIGAYLALRFPRGINEIQSKVNKWN